MAKFCGKCGAPMEAGDRFCMNCGESVKDIDEDLTIPLKSLEEKEISQDRNGSEKEPEKKTGLAARAVRGSDVNPKETNKNADVSHDDVDNVLKQDKKKRAQKANNTTNVPKKKTGLAARAVRRLDDNSKEMNGNSDDADDVLKQMEADNRQQAKSPEEKQSDATKSKKEPDKPKAVPPKKNGIDKTKTAPQKQNNKTIFIIVGIVVGVIAIGALIYCFATGILPPKTTVPISFKINIDEGFTKDSTPIVAKITSQSDKSKVTYTTFTTEDKNGKEIEMPQGQYEIEMISPINADGSIYDMGKTVSIDTSSEEERNVSISCKRIAAKNVTSIQIQGIADALKEASGNKSAEISESDIDKANERQKAKQVEEEKQKKAAEKQAAIDNAIAQGYDQIVTGKILMLDDKASVDDYFPENLKFGGTMVYHTPYALLCFDIPQNISALTSGSRAVNKQVSEICLSSESETWRAYDGETVTVAINTRDGRWASGLNPLRETGRFKNSMFVWKD